jgi:uncharacterized protein (TIGR02118 family)
MHKLIVTYKKPADVDAFMDHYTNVHIPLVEKIPGLARTEINRVTGSPMGGEPDLFMIVEMSFPDAETFKTAMRSPENMATGKDAMGFAKGLFSVMTAISDD